MDPVTPIEVVEAYRANALLDAHGDDPKFGYRLLTDKARDARESMADRTMWRIASSNGWWSAFGKKGGEWPETGTCGSRRPLRRDRRVGTDPTRDHSDRPEPAVVNRSHRERVGEGKLYLCAVKGGCLVTRSWGYLIDPRIGSSPAVRALKNAAAMRGDVAGCVVHSDRLNLSNFKAQSFSAL